MLQFLLFLCYLRIIFRDNTTPTHTDTYIHTYTQSRVKKRKNVTTKKTLAASNNSLEWCALNTQ